MEDIYVLPLTGEKIAEKLALIDGDSKAVEIKAEKIAALAATESTDNDLTLATKGYVDTVHGSATNTNSAIQDGDGEYSIVQKADSTETNKAISKYSMALGRNSIAGQKAYYIEAICWDKCQILLSTSSERDIDTRPCIYSGVDLISYANTSKDLGFAAPTFEYIPLTRDNFSSYFTDESYWGGGAKTFNEDGSCDITFTRNNRLFGREVPGIICTSLLQASEDNKFGVSFTVEATFVGSGSGHAGVSSTLTDSFSSSERVIDGDACIKEIDADYFIGTFLYTETETDAVSVTLKNFRLITGIEDGPKVDYISIIQPEDHLNRKRYITNVTGNVITFNSRFGAANEFDADSVDRWWGTQGLGIDDYTVYCPDKPDVGAVTITTTSYATGYHCAATGSYSSAEGVYCLSEGSYSHAEGQSTRAGYAAHSEGAGTIASGKYSHTEGFYTTGEGLGAHAEGFKTIARGDYSHSEGSGTTAGGAYSHAEGYNTEAKGLQTHAEGEGTKATGSNAHAEGQKTTASGQHSHAEGCETTASANHAHAEGYLAKASGRHSHAEGYNTSASGEAAHAEGLTTSASAKGTHAEGEQSVAGAELSHAEGYKTSAWGVQSHTEGNQTITYGIATHAEGMYTEAYGDQSHTEGLGSKTNEGAIAAHAEGSYTIAGGYGSHAEGDTSQALGTSCHAEGSATVAGGYLNENTGIIVNTGAANAHTEGSATYASGSNSHAEGNGTRADGAQAHAGGSYCYAWGENSFAHGFGCMTSTANAMVIGKFNVGRSNALFEVGNGAGGAARSNAFAVLNNGRVVLGSGSFGYVAPDTLEENALFFVIEQPDTITFTINYSGFTGAENLYETVEYTTAKGTTWEQWLTENPSRGFITNNGEIALSSPWAKTAYAPHNINASDVIIHEGSYDATADLTN